ncbi:hypothetical protein [Staphylococcus phage vB_ScaM-V1SC04]|nr:hypothetical protein [Staphylococcus phage vB_ScaM-V1SC04]
MTLSSLEADKTASFFCVKFTLDNSEQFLI